MVTEEGSDELFELATFLTSMAKGGADKLAGSTTALESVAGAAGADPWSFNGGVEGGDCSECSIID